MSVLLYRLKVLYWDLRAWWNPSYWEDNGFYHPGSGFE